MIIVKSFDDIFISDTKLSLPQQKKNLYYNNDLMIPSLIRLL